MLCIGASEIWARRLNAESFDGCTDECLILVDMEYKSMKKSLEDLQPSFDLTKARAMSSLAPIKIEGSLLRAWGRAAHDPCGDVVD